MKLLIKKYLNWIMNNNNCSRFARKWILKILLTDKEKWLLNLLAPDDIIETGALNGYLYNFGWMRSWDEKLFYDYNSTPLPWFTYPAIDFLRMRIPYDCKILEFGIGSSSLFFSLYTRHLTIIEHDKKWIDSLQEKLPSSVTIKHVEDPLSEDYYCAPISLGLTFDLIIIDGRNRIKCCSVAVGLLTEKGVIILDDSERVAYVAARIHLLSHGFKEMPLWGLRSQSTKNSCTSIFYRNNNCLNI